MAVESMMVPLGTAAPAFALPTPEGEIVRLDDLRGEALLVAFLCNHCPYVQHIADALGSHAAAWIQRGVVVVGIMSNDVDAYPEDAPAHMGAFAAEHGWTFPYLVDADQSTARAYHAACTPDFFLFDRARELVYRGRLDASRPGSGLPVTGEDLSAAIDALLAGEPVAQEQFGSIGCSIKWRPGREPEWAP